MNLNVHGRRSASSRLMVAGLSVLIVGMVIAATPSFASDPASQDARVPKRPEVRWRFRW